MNQPIVVLQNASRTSANDADLGFVNRDCSGLTLVIDITANAGALGSLTVSIMAKDPASGKFVLLLASTALTAVATTVLRIFPGATAAGNAAANDQVPNDFIVRVAHNVNPIAYSIGGQLVGT